MATHVLGCWSWPTGWRTHGVTHVAVEAMAVYWKPVWNVATRAAAEVLAEVRDNMAALPGVGHLVHWTGLCPRLDESARKRRSHRAHGLAEDARSDRVARATKGKRPKSFEDLHNKY